MDIDAKSGLIQPRGIAGVQQRMAQIQAQLDSLSNKASFGQTLQQTQATGGLAGNIPFKVDGASLQPDSAEVSKYKDLAKKIADEEGIDPDLFQRLIQQESSWNPYSRSEKGATGLAQLMPATAKGLGVNNINDPEQNLRGGAIYLRQMLDRFGDVDKALAAYNAGPGRVERSGGVPQIKETQDYVNKITRGILNDKIRSRITP